MAAPLCRSFGQPGLRHLRIGEDDPRNRVIVRFGRLAQQRVLDHHPRLMDGFVGETAAGNVADGINPAIGRAHLLVDSNAAGVVFDARRGKLEGAEIGRTARRDQQMACCNGFGTIGRREGDLHLPGLMQHSQHLDAGTHDDPLARELVQHDLHAFRIVIGQRPLGFEHCHPRAKAAKRLRQLQAGRAGADHHQMLRAMVEVEDRLIGEKRRVLEAGNRRNGRNGTGRDDKMLGLDLCRVADRDRRPVGEDRRASNDANAKPDVALTRIVGGPRGDTARMCSRTLAKSIVTGPAVTPKPGAAPMWAVRRAAAISAFEGRQP